MRIAKHYLGQIVELKWIDPTTNRVAVSKLPKGHAVLASWTEYGKVFDITDGVVIIAHSIGVEPMDTDDEVCYTSIPEDVVESIIILTPALPVPPSKVPDLDPA